MNKKSITIQPRPLSFGVGCDKTKKKREGNTINTANKTMKILKKIYRAYLKYLARQKKLAVEQKSLIEILTSVTRRRGMML